MQQALLLALQAILALVSSADTANKVADVISFLEKVIPIAVKLGQTFYESIKNIIAALRGSTTDADLLAQLDALDAQTDAEFDAIAAETDPELAAAGKAASDAAASGDQGNG